MNIYPKSAPHLSPGDSRQGTRHPKQDTAFQKKQVLVCVLFWQASKQDTPKQDTPKQDTFGVSCFERGIYSLGRDATGNKSCSGRTRNMYCLGVFFRRPETRHGRKTSLVSWKQGLFACLVLMSCFEACQNKT